MLDKGNRYLYQINKRCTNIVSIAVEGWSETEQQYEELGDANKMKRRRTHKEGNIRKAHLRIWMSRVNAMRFSQWFTEAKERSNSARRKKKDWPSRQWAAIELNLWHVSLSLELLMYIYMFSKLKCHDLKWLRTGTEIEFTGLWKPYICIWRNKLVWIADTPFFLSLYWRKLNFEVFWLISV